MIKATCILAKNRPKTGRFFESFALRPIRKSAQKLAEIEFGPDQKSAENRSIQPIRTVHKL